MLLAALAVRHLDHLELAQRADVRMRSEATRRRERVGLAARSAMQHALLLVPAAAAPAATPAPATPSTCSAPTALSATPSSSAFSTSTASTASATSTPASASVARWLDPQLHAAAAATARWARAVVHRLRGPARGVGPPKLARGRRAKVVQVCRRLDVERPHRPDRLVDGLRKQNAV